jgi:carbon storage regulator
MLVLSRKLGEQVMVPSCDMTVTVVAIEGNNVRLGFTAPHHVEVYRQEVLERMHKGETCLSGAEKKLRRIHS